MNMGMMVRFIQELEAYWLAVEFSDHIAMVVNQKPESFSFEQLTKQRAMEQNQGLVNCAVQGFLYKKKTELFEYWKMLLN